MKQAYIRPAVTKHGTIQQITKGALHSNGNDGGLGRRRNSGGT